MCNFQVFLCCCFFFYKFLRGKKCATRYSFCLSYQEEQQLITMAMALKETLGALPLFHFLLRWPWTSFVPGPQGWKHLCTKSWQCRAIYLGLTIACFSSLLVCYQEERKYLPLNSIIVFNRWEAEYLLKFWPLCELHITSFHVMTTWPCQRQRFTLSC